MNGKSLRTRSAEISIIFLLLIFLPLLVIVGERVIADGRTYLSAQQQVDNLHQQLHALDGVLLTLQEAETGQRGYLLTGKEEYLQPYRTAIDAVDMQIDVLTTLFAEEHSKDDRIKEIVGLARRKLDDLAYTIELGRTKGQDAAVAVVQVGLGREVMKELRSVISGIRVEKTAALNIEFDLVVMRQSSTRKYGIALVILLAGFSALTIGVALRGLRLKRLLNEQLHRDSHHDPLTLLPNRRFLSELLGYTIAQAQRAETRFALLYIDLDGFKQINDSYGHPIGDALLQAVARRFLDAVREADMVARLGGDEFAVLMSKLQAADDVQKIATRLHDALKAELLSDYPNASVKASIGVAFYPDAGNTAEELLKHADRHMYEAKRKTGKHAAQRQVRIAN